MGKTYRQDAYAAPHNQALLAFGLLNPSLEGGLELFWKFLFNRSSAVLWSGLDFILSVLGSLFCFFYLYVCHSSSYTLS